MGVWTTNYELCEVYGTLSMAFGDDGFTASVQLMFEPWTDAINIARDISGQPFPYNDALFCTSASITPLLEFSDVVGEQAIYTKGYINVSYTEGSRNGGDSNAAETETGTDPVTGQPYTYTFTESTTPSLTMRRLGHEDYIWMASSGNPERPLLEDESPSKLEARETINRTYTGARSLPDWLEEYNGKVNEMTWTNTYTGKVYPPETLLYQLGNYSKTVTKTVDDTVDPPEEIRTDRWTITVTLTHNPNGWNQFIPQDSNVPREIALSADPTTAFKPYESVAFNFVF